MHRRLSLATSPSITEFLAVKLSRLGLFRRRSSSFRRRHQARECGRVLHRNVCQNLAIQRDAGSFQPVNQLSVGQTVQTRRGTDTLNPQAAILALLDATIALGVPISAVSRFLRGLVQLALGEEKAFCALEVLLTPRTALCAAFYASHGMLL